MPTFTAFTTLAGHSPAENLGAALERLNPEPTGIGVFVIEDGSGQWEVGGYFSEPPDTTGLALLAAGFEARPFVVSEVPDTDWVAHVRRELSPVQAGRFFVYGSHDADKVPQGSVALLIEAAMAFGTGHHGTTLGCLQALERLLVAGFSAQRVADIGCGTAVLAMAAARCFDAKVVAGDIDPIAVEVARANLGANDLEKRVSCVQAAGFDHSELAKGHFDLIFANILKGPLIALAPDIDRAANPSGFCILSGILNEQADDIVSVYNTIGWNLVYQDQIGDWSTLTLENIRPSG